MFPTFPLSCWKISSTEAINKGFRQTAVAMTHLRSAGRSINLPLSLPFTHFGLIRSCTPALTDDFNLVHGKRAFHTNFVQIITLKFNSEQVYKGKHARILNSAPRDRYILTFVIGFQERSLI